MGFELTEAGKVLTVDRWAEGQSDAEVVLEVITAVLTHAARREAFLLDPWRSILSPAICPDEIHLHAELEAD